MLPLAARPSQRVFGKGQTKQGRAGVIIKAVVDKGTPAEPQRVRLEGHRGLPRISATGDLKKTSRRRTAKEGEALLGSSYFLGSKKKKKKKRYRQEKKRGRQGRARPVVNIGHPSRA